MLAGLLTAQNSCIAHEECDSSCSGRIDARWCRLMPNGTQQDEVDLRAQSATMNKNTGVPVRTEPLAISDGVLRFSHSPLVQPESTVRLLKIKRGLLRADPSPLILLGTPPDGIKFLFNGKVFYGRASLERALKRLRAGFRSRQREEYIWADAICINQTILAENDAQARLMGRIYPGVVATVYVDLVDIQSHEVSMGDFTLRFPALGGVGVQDTLTVSDNPGHPFHYKMAFQALSQPPFSGTWTIQEVALARSVKYMFHGNIFTHEHLHSILSEDAMVANPDRQYELTRSNATILHETEVTTPEDKIFGLFALMSDADREAIRPYSRSLEQVFKHFAALQVCRGRGITMLDSGELQRRRQIADGNFYALLSALLGFRRSAITCLTCWRRHRDRGNSVRGLIIDTIDTIPHVHTAPLTPSGQPDFLFFHDKFRAAFDELVAKGRSVYVNNEEAFARLLLMDDMYTGADSNIRRAASVGRGFATTRNGYTGLVPPLAQTGDQAVVILGARVPYVVRKVQSGYLLVGDAFVHGFMYGEALERRDLRPMDIVLV
ncbi:heterokaryon incompatibility protein 6 [Xylaria longipes]|nr:heterokaryon incompatibility protein 6 [Xylaria longipes]